MLSLVPDDLLAAHIPLPAHATVAYVRFDAVDGAVQDHTHIELARRHVLSEDTLVDSLLSSVHIGSSSFIYIFAIQPHSQSRLSKLQFDGLTANPLDHLCSCSHHSSFNCKDCLYNSLIPRPTLREPYSHFLEAIRTRLLDDLARSPLRHISRLKGGFLLGAHKNAPSNEWSKSWEYRIHSRPLLYCHLHLSLSRTHILIHPILLQTPFVPLPSPPPPPGAPITLLPYGTPAFFLSIYKGPTSSLAAHFLPALKGLGIPTPAPTYVIAWIAIENSQGEDKGLALIYPASLCLAFSPSSSPSRQPLSHIPTLPTPLQPSPHLPNASTTHPPPIIPSTTYPTPSIPSHSYDHLPPTPSTPTLLTLRTLTLPLSKPIPHLAREVASYVDAVARERERERERLKRERESASTSISRMPSTSAPPTTSAPPPISSTTPLLTTSHPIAQLHAQTQNFYPSPPQTNATAPAPAPTVSSAPTPVAVPGPAPVPGAVPPAPSPAPVPTPSPAPQPPPPLGPLPAASVPAPAPAQAQGGFDNFSTDAWGMGMDMDMDIDFNMDMGLDMGMGMGMGGMSSMGMGFDMSMSSDMGMGGMNPPSHHSPTNPRTTRNTVNATSTTLDFDDTAFTDDDFSFFDRPSHPLPPSSHVPLPSSSHVPLPSSSHAPLPSTSHIQTLPTPSTFPPTQTPAAHSPIFELHPHPHASLPFPSPNPTPPTFLSSITSSSFPPSTSAAYQPTPSAGAPTPGVRLSNSWSFPGPGGPASGFDPIPFSPYHRVLDGKYASGKFSFGLPSPPDEEDRTIGYSIWGSRRGSLMCKDNEKKGKGKERERGQDKEHDDDDDDGKEEFKEKNQDQNGLRKHYTLLTDPRIGVVRKLIGVKRKLASSSSLPHPRPSKPLSIPLPRSLPRPTPAKLSSAPAPPISTSWDFEHEDWNWGLPTPSSTADHDSDSDSDYSMLSGDDSDSASTSNSRSRSTSTHPHPSSRPTTPAPSYLPPGPALLQTRFEHRALMGFATALPAEFISNPHLPPNNPPHTQELHPPPPASVPTPLSPGLALASSKSTSKSLEAAALTLAGEIVANPPFGAAWRAYAPSSYYSGVWEGKEPWLADVRDITRVLGSVRGVESPLPLSTLFTDSPSPPTTTSPPTSPSTSPSSTSPSTKPSSGNDTTIPPTPLTHLPAPLLTLSKGDAIIQVLPPALRFWEKLGLGPRGGAKHGTVFVLYENSEGEGNVKAEAGVGDAHEREGEGERTKMVQAWLEGVQAGYEGFHLGTLVPGKNASCPKDGLVPVRFDSSFRKILASLIASLPASQTSLIFFIIIPMSIMSLSSPTLRQIFSAVTKAGKTYSEAQIHFQFVPEHLIHGSLSLGSSSLSSSRSHSPSFSPSSPNTPDTTDTCTSIYNRILVPVDRTMSRRFFEHGVRVRRYFQEPTLTLARPAHSHASFVRATRAHASLDVMDRGTFFHVGYRVSACGGWLLAVCVDQRGEAYEVGVWLMRGPREGSEGAEEGEGEEGEGEEEGEGGGEGEAFVVRKVWEFAMQFAKKADVEWKIVFSKIGAMGESELDAWTTWIESHSRGLRISSFTLLSVEPDAPWTFCSTKPQPPKSPPPKSPPTKAHNTSRTSLASKSQPQNIFTDISSTIFVTPAYTSLPQSTPPTLADLGVSLSHIPEPGLALENEQGPSSPLVLPHPLPLLPQSTTTLVCVPSTPSPTAISMLHVHLLHNTRPSGVAAVSTPEDISSLHTAITHNFHELAALARARWHLDVNPILPFHLAAVEAIQIALCRDQIGIDGTTDTT